MADVDLIRELHEEHRLPLSRLAIKFGVAKSTVQSIVEYRTWTRLPVRWRRMK